MKKIYDEPIIEIVVMEEQDIITQSGDTVEIDFGALSNTQ